MGTADLFRVLDRRPGHGESIRKAIAVLALAGLASGGARADEGPRTYALVSAIGSTLQYVKPRFSTGSHLGEYQRAELAVPDASLDAAALRGLEKIVRAGDPQARVEYLRLNPEELKDVDPVQRGGTAVGKLATALERLPGRERWHRILIVAPRYVANEREGMGAKLQGVGIFVQTLERGVFDGGGNAAQNFTDAYETVTPDGVKFEGRSTAFVAPYFYAQVWVLDARTLEVINRTERFDLVRIADPGSDANRIENAIPAERLGPLVEGFVEKAAERAAREAIGVVTVSEPKVVK